MTKTQKQAQKVLKTVEKLQAQLEKLNELNRVVLWGDNLRESSKASTNERTIAKCVNLTKMMDELNNIVKL